MNIVLHQPEIPGNTGNIARLCAATGTLLHLVGPLGFSLSDRYLKRAGLDYWPHVRLQTYDSLQDLYVRYPGGRFFYFSTKATRWFTKVEYRDDDFLVFGRETKGLPEDLLAANPDTSIAIPMDGPVRSLNLSTAAGIALYEALRQVRGY
ncbi:MAG: tRNA (cytidine(34)-2'-O)-methyltransferase [Nitrospirae bacterium]|nr:tRNA (cytidine(34)-2'-O)-methyltransferase [Nitrospirota bacterium]